MTNHALKTVAGLLLVGVSVTALAIGPGELASLERRIDEERGINYGGYQQTVEIKSIASDWQANPARATLKYSKPTAYRGALKRVAVRNESDGDLVFDAGNGQEITAVLFPYQLGPWIRRESGKWEPQGAITTMDFAASYDPGQEFVLTCKKAQPGYLLDCLATPADVIRYYENRKPR